MDCNFDSVLPALSGKLYIMLVNLFHLAKNDLIVISIGQSLINNGQGPVIPEMNWVYVTDIFAAQNV